MSETARRAPDTQAAREALYRALRLLNDRENPLALAEARKAAQEAAEAVPYPWQAPHCAEYRRNAKNDACRSRTCTRCAAVRAGDRIPVSDR
ncbi:hypothetical protein [Streptomyces aureoverticillatus]|uniref:hypothetical protein n=1 Tax=Streptomyces aureoverticillatus TaxID=66871 RepID=UPI0013DD7A9A|nr:hypothetical protein [Streptomyces aureoverticillatus]QIB49483.1 hypothetical protein G3H79_40625 [Streptomyces aureoverticillatus]